MGLVPALAVPSVYPDFFAIGIEGRAFRESIINATVVRELATRTLGKEIFSIGLVYVMKGFVGALPVLGVHSLVDVTDDFLVALHQVEVFARFVLP